MILGYGLKSYSQEKVDNIFKILLILDNAITFKTKDSNENPDIQSLVMNIDLKVKEIENSLFKPIFFYNYKIYKFDVINDSIIVKNNLSTLSIFGECSEYIIILNEESQRYYRIKGFKQNDFSHLLNDIILHYDEKISEREVVKKLNLMEIKELDFNCMYQYLKDSPKNRWKYPCMSICTDGKPSHLNK